MSIDRQEVSKNSYRVLYIDSDPLRTAQVQMFFNDANNESPRFFFFPASTYRFALQVLAICHLDELAQTKGWKPFDFVIFDLDIKNSKDKYNWFSFIESLFELGLLRLNFPFGIGSLMALGNPCEAVKDSLLSFQIKLINRPLSTNKLREELLLQISRFEGSPIFYIDPRTVEESGNRKVVQRLLRYSKPLSNITLSYEEVVANDDGTQDITPIFKRNADYFESMYEFEQASLKAEIPELEK